jgi:GT2 family glycosyltransferase
MISVLVVTYRAGQWDANCDSLKIQTFKDFELVVADAIFDRRNPIIRDRFADYDFPIKHIAEPGGMFLSNYSRSINTALTHCSGELVVIQADYTWMPPDCLETHWNAYKNGPPRTCYMLDNHCTGLPPLRDDFPGYGPNWEAKHYTEAERPAFEAQMNTAAEQYAADVASGKLDGCMWSLFKEPLTNEAVMALPITRSHVKQGQALDPNWCSLKNEAIPMECFLEVNGLDEDFDASHLYQDQEFAWRAHRAGWTWSTVPGGAAYMVNPRSVFYSKFITRPMMSNGDLMRSKGGVVRVNPGRDLRAEREANLRG